MSIFGGEFFVDWIGEISFMKDLIVIMDIIMFVEEEEVVVVVVVEVEVVVVVKDGEFFGIVDVLKESFKILGGELLFVVLFDKLLVFVVVVEEEIFIKKVKEVGYNIYNFFVMEEVLFLYIKFFLLGFGLGVFIFKFGGCI